MKLADLSDWEREKVEEQKYVHFGNNSTKYRLVNDGGFLTSDGIAYVLGLRASLSTKGQAVVDKAMENFPCRLAHGGYHIGSLGHAVSVYRQSLTPSPSIEDLEKDEIHSARSVANYILKYGMKDTDETLKELTSFHRNTSFALTAAKAPPKPNDVEMLRHIMKAVGNTRSEDLPATILEAYEAFKEAYPDAI